MSVSTHQMPGGGTATVLHRKVSTEKTLLVHFGFQRNTFMICGFCGAGSAMREGQNYEDAAKWFNKHCRNLRQGHGRIPSHHTEDMLNVKTLAEIIAKTANAGTVRDVFGKDRSRLVSKHFLKTILGDVVLESMMHKSNVVMSHCCLSRAEVRVNCCIKRKSMTVEMYRAGVKMDPLYCTDDLALLKREYAMLEPPTEPRIPPSPSTSMPNSSSSLAQPSANSEQKVASANLLAGDVARSAAETPASAGGSEKKLRLMIAPVKDRVNFAVEEITNNNGAALAQSRQSCMKMAQPDTKKTNGRISHFLKLHVET